MEETEDESDERGVREWGNVEIPSRWIWEDASASGTVGGSNANNSNLSLCRRRARQAGSRVGPTLYVRKVLTRNPRRGMVYVKRELDMLQRCEHRNILCYEDFSYSSKSWDDPTAKLFTEYCAQGDLDRFTITDNGPNRNLSLDLGVQVFSQLTQALLYIHHGISLTLRGFPEMAEAHTARASGTIPQHGEWRTILHRDLKPSNVFVAQLSRDGIHVKLGDFGLARVDTSNTQSYVGSRDWLAPEQHHSNNNRDGKRRTTLKSDIYSFGLTMHAVMSRHILSGRQYSPAVSCVNTLIGRCLDHQDTHRPTSVTLIDELKRFNVIQRQGSMMRDVAHHHLHPRITRPHDHFWRHETACLLCRRLLKAGGVRYVEDFDRVRLQRYQKREPQEPLLAMPESMDMSRLTSVQIRSVQLLRAKGESRENAIICVCAMPFLNGSEEDCKLVALLVSRGIDFQQAVAQIRQKSSGKAPARDVSEDESDDNAEDDSADEESD